MRATKRGCALASWATRPSKTLRCLQGNKHFCKTALLHPKMVGIICWDLFWTSWSSSKGPGKVSPLIWPPPMRREPEESHKVSGWQNETPMVPERVTQGCLFFFESRWFAVAASERKRGMFTAQLGHPTVKNLLFSSRKQAFLQNRSFASKDGWGRVLRPVVDVWGPLEKARGRDSTHPKKGSDFKKSLKKS